MSAAKQNWPRVKLGEVCEEIHERIASSEIAVDTYVTTDNMLKNCAGVSVAEYVPDGVGLVRYEKGDVLLANIRPYLKKLWRATHDGGCSSDVVVFRSRLKELSSEYLFAALSQDRFFDYVMLKPRGTKMPRGDRDWMKEFEFPLPPLPVQREIVARLERELGAVDELAKKFEELEQTAEAEFKAELKETFEELGDGTNGTSVRRVKLGEVSTIGYGYTAKALPVCNTKPRYLRITDIQNDTVNWNDVPSCECEELDEYALHSGDIVFARTGATTGKSYLLQGEFPLSVFASYLIRVVINDKDVLRADYLKYYFDTPEYWNAIQCGMAGAAQGGFNSKKLAALEVSLPPLPTQRAIVARLDAAKARKEALVSAAKRGREAAVVWRKAILKEAFE